MKIQDRHYRTIWLAEDGWSVMVIDQTQLPHAFDLRRWTTLQDAADGIAHMVVRGAPLIGVAAAYGLCLALRTDASDAGLERAAETLAATRPTAVNLRWALARMADGLRRVPVPERVAAAYAAAGRVAHEGGGQGRRTGGSGG